MDNVVIGQYIPGNSVIHKLDPRMKIIFLIILIVSLFVAHSIMIEAILLVFTLALIATAGIPFKKVLGGLKGILFLLLFTAMLQMGSITTGELIIPYKVMHITFYTTLISIGIFIFYIFTRKFIPFRFIYFLLMVAGILVTQYFLTDIISVKFLSFDLHYNIRVFEGGLIRAGFIVLRIINLIMLSSLLTFTTAPMEMKNALESLMKPLKVIHFPVGEIAMMISLVLRFIPTLLDETNKIMKAQASRGVDFNESTFKQKINQIVSLLVPMFVVSFKRADELANAMESRGYVIGENRTSIDVMKTAPRDYISLFIVVLLLASVIVSSIFKTDLWSVIL